VAVCYLNNDDV